MGQCNEITGLGCSASNPDCSACRLLAQLIWIVKRKIAKEIVPSRNPRSLVEILGEGGAHRFGHDRHMPVIRVVEADQDLGSGLLEYGDLGWGEWKADELHRRGLSLGTGVLAGRIGPALDALAGDPDKGAVLDAAEPRQRGFAALRIVDLEHDGGAEFAALRDQRVVGCQLVLDLLLAAL